MSFALDNRITELEKNIDELYELIETLQKEVSQLTTPTNKQRK